MSARILDGRACADAIQGAISRTVKILPRPPRLDVILVGNDPASAVYVGAKEKACAKVGFHSHIHRLNASTSQKQLFDLIDELNNNPAVDGILLQLPLPQGLDSQPLLEHIDTKKDVDGFHPYNTGRLCLRLDGFAPCTPKGIMKLLDHYHIPVLGKHAVVVGASNIVGRPAALELLGSGATVTVCHRFTADLKTHVENADILVVAVGKPNLIPGSWIKPNTVVIDVGINRLANGDLCGDVEFAAAAERAAWITPVPGGVGPMTIAILLQHTLESSQNRQALCTPGPVVN